MPRLSAARIYADRFSCQPLDRAMLACRAARPCMADAISMRSSAVRTPRTCPAHADNKSHRTNETGTAARHHPSAHFETGPAPNRSTANRSTANRSTAKWATRSTASGSRTSSSTASTSQPWSRTLAAAASTAEPSRSVIIRRTPSAAGRSLTANLCRSPPGDNGDATSKSLHFRSPTFIVWKPDREGRLARSTVWETSSRWFDRCSRCTRPPRRDRGRSG